MAIAQEFWIGDDHHPIDLVESLASDHQWEFDRVTDDQIAMAVEGLWRSYAITLSWSPQDETLRLICTFEMEPPEMRQAALCDLLNRVNDQVWSGAFSFWSEQKLMVWRYGLILAGGAVAGAGQLNRMISDAITGCERFYPAFQLVAWADRDPAEAMKVAMSEAWGRA